MITNAIKTLVAVDEGVDAWTIESLLPAGAPLQIVGIIEGLENSSTLLEETSPDLLIVACAAYSEHALHMISASHKQQPDRPIVVFYLGVPNGFMQRAFEAGADDFLVVPETQENILFSIEKVMTRRRSRGDGANAAPMICVLGPKGGTGKTVTACNLSAALAAEGKRAVIVDLDLQFGDVGVALGLRPDRTIADLVKAGGTIDSEKVNDFLVDHASGVRALLAPRRPDEAAGVTVPFLNDVFKALRVDHDFVIVDTAPAFSPEIIAAIDAASHLCMVGTLDALSLKDTKLGLETLELMGIPSERVVVVLNRSDVSVGISHSDVESILARRPEVLVPQDDAVPRSVTNGVPVVAANERSGAAAGYRSLAQLYIHATAPVANGNAPYPRKFGLTRMFARKGE